MKKWLIGLLAASITLFAATPGLAMADLSKLNRLDNVSVSVAQGEAKVSLGFDKDLGKNVKPTFSENSIQFDIDGAYITPSKRQFKADGKFAKSISATQVDPKKVRVRLLLNEDSGDLANNYSGKLNGSKMVAAFKLKGATKAGDDEAKQNAKASADNAKQTAKADAEEVKPTLKTATREPAAKEKEEPANEKTAPKTAENNPVIAALNGKPVDAKKQETPKAAPAPVQQVAQMQQVAQDNVAASAAPAKKIAADDLKDSTLDNPQQAKENVNQLDKRFGFLTRPAHAQDNTDAAQQQQQGSKTVTEAAKDPAGFLKYQAPIAPEAPSLNVMVVKMISSLALVLAVVFALSWVGKKYMSKFNNVFGGDVVRVLATGSVGVKKQIAVVDVAGETLVIGVTGDSITMLTTIEDRDVIDRLRRQAGGDDYAIPSGIPAPSRIDEEDEAPTPRAGGILKQAINALRIGRVKGVATNKSKALFDEDDPDTFVGNLSRAGKSAAIREYTSHDEHDEDDDDEPLRGNAPEPKLTREELVAKVTGAIRAKNNNLRLA